MFENEQALEDAGYILTPNIFHSGKGNGKIYAKSFDNVAPFTNQNPEGGKHYEHYSVDVDGTVAEWKPSVNFVATSEDTSTTPAPTESEAQPETPSTDEVQGEKTEGETSPEGSAEATGEESPAESEATG